MKSGAANDHSEKGCLTESEASIEEEELRCGKRKIFETSLGSLDPELKKNTYI